MGDSNKTYTVRDALTLWEALGEYEIIMWMRLGERLKLGQERYGKFKKGDKRNWKQQRVEEGLDWCIYAIAEEVLDED